jgi:hypothetical protein
LLRSLSSQFQNYEKWQLLFQAPATWNIIRRLPLDAPGGSTGGLLGARWAYHR